MIHFPRLDRLVEVLPAVLRKRGGSFPQFFNPFRVVLGVAANPGLHPGLSLLDPSRVLDLSHTIVYLIRPMIGDSFSAS